MVKRQPTVRETWVPSLGREDPLEKEMAGTLIPSAQRLVWAAKQPLGKGAAGHCLQAVQKANLFIAYYKLSSCSHPFKDLKHLDLRIFLKGALESYFHC